MKKSIKNLIADKINEVRGMLKILDDPKASNEAKGTVLADLVGSDPAFWQQIAAVVSRKPATKKVIAAPAQQPTAAKTVQTTAPTPGTILSAPAPAPKPPVVATKLMPAKPAALTGTAPARMLQVAPPAKPEPTLVEKRDRFVNKLKQFVNDGAKIDGAEIRRNLEGMLGSGVELESKHFEAVFTAAKKASEVGFYIIDKKSTGIFYRAPVEVVDNYVFGQDGEMVQVLAGLNETNDIGKAGKIVARTYIMLDALDAMKKAGRLGEFENSRVEALFGAFKRLGHEKLADEINQLLSSSQEEELEKIHQQAKVENRPFAGLKEMLAS